MRRMTWVLIVALLALVDVTYSQNPRQDLAQLAEEFQRWRLEQNPEAATVRGICTFNDKLRNYNVSRYDDYNKTVVGFNDRLKAISRSGLYRDENITYSVLEYHLQSYLDNFQWRFYTNLSPINFLEGLLRDLQILPPGVPTNTKGDVENYLQRLQAYPQQIDEIEDSMRLAVAYNTTNHRVTMDRLGPMFDILLAVNGTTFRSSPLFIPFKVSVDDNDLGYTANERIQILARVQSAILAFLERLQLLKDFIDTDYVSRTEIGVRSFPRGGEYYESIMKWYLSLDLSPQQVHDMGVKEVNRIATRMREIMKEQNFQGTISEYFAFLMEDDAFFYNTSEGLLEGYRKQINDEIQPTLTQLFNEPPTLPVVVRPISTDGPQGRYSRGSADGITPGTFWANVLRPRDTPRFGMMALTMHETNPGHHLQSSVEMTSSLPDFRKSIVFDNYFEAPVSFSSFAAYSEGWALYVENLGEDVGLYKDDYELMGKYSSEIFRACRLVVDTGIHYFNWERDHAVNYVLNYTAFTRATAETEIDRYITWPGQALTYKIGEMKILELREKAKQKLGGAFDIKNFHDVILRNGRVPLGVLEQLVDQWVASYHINEQAIGPASATTSKPDSAPRHICRWTLPLALLALFTFI